MSSEPQPGRSARWPHSWRKKARLLNFLETLHLAEDLDSFLGSLVELLREEFDALEVFFTILDSRSRRLVYFLPEAIQGVPVVMGEGFSGQALSEQRPLMFRVSDGPLPYHYLPETATFHRAVNSVLTTPLERHGRVVGTLELLDKRNGGEYSDADLNYLAALAPHVAVAVNQFVLTQEARRREEEENRLREISRSIHALLNLREILE